MKTISESDARQYYRAALLLLRFIENRKPTGRRFGPDADALWSTFHGDLSYADRIDLLISDADAEWPGAFGARGVFDLRAVAEDDAFGSEWRALDAVTAGELWHDIETLPPPSDSMAALSAVAETWGLKLSPKDIAPVDPTDHVVAAGASAVVALVRAFEQGTDLDWHTQVVCVASSPAVRQLAGAAAALLGAAAVCPILASDASVDGVPLANRKLVSDDAAPEDANLATQLAGEVAI